MGMVKNRNNGKGRRKGQILSFTHLRVFGITTKLRETSLIRNFLFKLHCSKPSLEPRFNVLIGFKEYNKPQLHSMKSSTKLKPKFKI